MKRNPNESKLIAPIQGEPLYPYVATTVPSLPPAYTTEPLVFGKGSIIFPEGFVDIDFVR